MEAGAGSMPLLMVSGAVLYCGTCRMLQFTANTCKHTTDEPMWLSRTDPSVQRAAIRQRFLSVCFALLCNQCFAAINAKQHISICVQAPMQDLPHQNNTVCYSGAYSWPNHPVVIWLHASFKHDEHWITTCAWC